MDYKPKMSHYHSNAAADILGYTNRCFAHAWHQSSPNTRLTVSKTPPGT